ncbi:MAG: hypothetical protein MUF53_12505, partial [Gemmatimonadaceae bacterium]|nr:hypothetical protein [Gemmatimonadaceae bacterium]
MNPQDAIGFTAVLGAVAWAGAGRANSADAYTVADRSIGLWPLVATLVMTEFNTSTLLAFSAAGYGAGPMAIALPAVFLVGLLFYTVSVAKAWKRFNRLSVAELFAVRYSPALGRCASALLLLAMAGFSATYVKSLTVIFTPFAPSWSPWAWSAGLTGIVLLVVVRGGLPSVVRADQVGFVLTVVLLPTLCWLGWRALPATGLAAAFPESQRTFDPVAQWRHPALPFRFVTSLMVLTCVTYIAAPWYGQKIFAARDERTAYRAVGLSALLVFALYGATVLAAAAYRAAAPPLADAQAVVPAMLTAWFP